MVTTVVGRGATKAAGIMLEIKLVNYKYAAQNRYEGIHVIVIRNGIFPHVMVMLASMTSKYGTTTQLSSSAMSSSSCEAPVRLLPSAKAIASLSCPCSRMKYII